VKGQIITLEWFERVLELKGPYTKFRIRWLLEQIQKLEQIDSDDRDIKKQLNRMKTELKELEKLSGHPQQLREATLDNLVNDILIQEEINRLISYDPTKRDRLVDTEANLSKILDNLKIHQGNNYPPLLSKDGGAIEEIRKILGIFRRHERFAIYLRWNDRGVLQDWLKEQKNREKTEIAINYDLAKVKPPKKARLFNLFSVDPHSFS
jgi:hypothetical protein